jgi:hypothetical protein
MATGKKFFWIKLKKDFLTGERIDFLLSQKNGSDYVVIYLLLCMICINTDGKLERRLGEVMIPFDVEKIQRDCKYFNKDTIIVAMELYKKLGLVYEDADGVLKITDYSELVGVSTDYALQKSRQRKALPAKTSGNTVDNVHTHTVDNTADNVHTEIRDKSLEIRDKSLEIRDKSLEIRDKSLESRKKTTGDSTSPNGDVSRTNVRRIQDAWNALSDIGITPIRDIDSESTRAKLLKARIRQVGIDGVLQAIEKIRDSPFLQGQNKRGWSIKFDWFIKPSNFQKVLEGTYDDTTKSTQPHNRFAERAKEVKNWTFY